MESGSDVIGGRMDRFKAALKRAGVKLTQQRLEIFREVARSADHPDAETVYKGVRERIPPVSLDTVYRTLWLLLDLHLIDTLGPRDRIRFDTNTGSHHHFICRKCGLARDFTHAGFDRLKLPAAVKSFGRVDMARLELRGVCRKCAQAERSKPLRPTWRSSPRVHKS